MSPPGRLADDDKNHLLPARLCGVPRSSFLSPVRRSFFRPCSSPSSSAPCALFSPGVGAPFFRKRRSSPFRYGWLRGRRRSFVPSPVIMTPGKNCQCCRARIGFHACIRSGLSTSPSFLLFEAFRFPGDGHGSSCMIDAPPDRLQLSNFRYFIEPSGLASSHDLMPAITQGRTNVPPLP